MTSTIFWYLYALGYNTLAEMEIRPFSGIYLYYLSFYLIDFNPYITEILLPLSLILEAWFT